MHTLQLYNQDRTSARKLQECTKKNDIIPPLTPPRLSSPALRHVSVLIGKGKTRLCNGPLHLRSDPKFSSEKIKPSSKGTLVRARLSSAYRAAGITSQPTVRKLIESHTLYRVTFFRASLVVPMLPQLPGPFVSVQTSTKTQQLTSSNTSFNLYCVRAEHSTYFTAPSSFAIFSPLSFVTGAIFCLASFSRTCPSSLKSVCVPTMRHGTPGQWWWTSGNHFSRTFSNDAGDVTEKQTRKTSVCG